MSTAHAIGGHINHLRRLVNLCDVKGIELRGVRLTPDSISLSVTSQEQVTQLGNLLELEDVHASGPGGAFVREDTTDDGLRITVVGWGGAL